MKVTRLWRNNRIDVTDGELEALACLVRVGVAAIKAGAADPKVSLAGKRGMGRIIARSGMVGGVFAVDEDRRKERESDAEAR